LTLGDRFREWRIDHMTDRIARRPHGRAARRTHGSPTVHDFAWAPVLEARAAAREEWAQLLYAR
jgi:hypothetical protein